MKPPASPALPNAVGASVAEALAAFFAAAILVVAPAAALKGPHPFHLDETIAPGPLSFVVFALGWLVFMGARRMRTERWAVALAGLVVVGAALTPDHLRRTILLGVAPLMALALARLGSLRTGLAAAAGALGASILGSRLPNAERFCLIVLAAALIVISPLLIPTPSPPRARFDLRASLGFACAILAGLAFGLAFSTLDVYAQAPKSYGGVGLALTAAAGVWWIVIVGAQSLLGRFRSGGERSLLGLLLALLGAGLLLIPSSPVFWVGSSLLLAGLGLAAFVGLRRASRAARGWGLLALGLSTLGGMDLAPALVRAFSKPLPGLIAVEGAEVSQRTDWPLVLGFYLALTAVVLLAHLAFAYEFGFAPLDPDDSTDPLPIKRKGLAGVVKR